VAVIALATVLALWLWRWFIRRSTKALSDSTVAARLAASNLASDPLTTGQYRARASAVAGLLTSVGAFVISAVGVIAALARLGVNVAPILASAGVVGIAVGFGAQTIIRDFLSGVFMILENQYGVGDVVVIDTISGTVESVGLRITEIRGFDGTIWYVTNGSVTQLGNMSQGWSLAVVDVPVGYGSDLDAVTHQLLGVARQLQTDDAWKSKILPDEPLVAAESTTPLAVTFRIRMRTVANEQLAVGRELRTRAVNALEAAGVTAAAATPPEPDEADAQ
jgi:small conductance mechanosensitive channel